MCNEQKNELINNPNDLIKNEFKEFITDNDHPCIMAKAATKFDRVTMHIYEDFGSMEAAKQIIVDIMHYINSYDRDSNEYESMVAVFPNESTMTENKFENLLWRQLTLIHQADSEPWDETVSKDPKDPDFSFSILGKAFYIVGLHPNSSRSARRFKYPAIAFNFHHQFEKLRELGTYEKVRNTIRLRDKEKNRSVNPMLQDFGVHSEARQYSGRSVEKFWECPFKHSVGG